MNKNTVAMSFFRQNLPDRQTIRLKEYDYSSEGLYFITLCVQNHLCLFGKINPSLDYDTELDKGQENNNPAERLKSMVSINDAGRMVMKWYLELENKFPNIHCYEMTVMPNHFHCLIEITDLIPVRGIEQINGIDEAEDYGMDHYRMVSGEAGAHVGAPLRGRPQPIPPNRSDHYGPDNRKYHAAIGEIIGWFKTMTTNEYIRGVKFLGWKRFNGKLWQRNYYEHIIHSDRELDCISDYILENPCYSYQDRLYNREKPEIG